MLHVITVNRRRNGERLELIKNLVMIPFTASGKNRSNPRQSQIANVPSFQIEDFKLRRSILLVLHKNLPTPK